MHKSSQSTSKIGKQVTVSLCKPLRKFNYGKTPNCEELKFMVENDPREEIKIPSSIKFSHRVSKVFNLLSQLRGNSESIMKKAMLYSQKTVDLPDHKKSKSVRNLGLLTNKLSIENICENNPHYVNKEKFKNPIQSYEIRDSCIEERCEENPLPKIKVNNKGTRNGLIIQTNNSDIKETGLLPNEYSSKTFDRSKNHKTKTCIDSQKYQKVSQQNIKLPHSKASTMKYILNTSIIPQNLKEKLRKIKSISGKLKENALHIEDSQAL